jgi:hypothetical protein
VLKVAESLGVGLSEIHEVGQLCHPLNEDLGLLAVQYFFSKQRTRAVAEIFNRLVRANSNYSHPLAEFLSSTDQPRSAEFWRLTTPDHAASLKARTVQWINLEKFPLVFALPPTVANSFFDDQLRYASAYGLFRYHRLAEAQELIDQTKASALLSQVAKFRSLLEACQKQGWSCRP